MSTDPYYYDGFYELSLPVCLILLCVSLRLKWLVQAVHSSETFICHWMELHGPCNREFRVQDLSDHLREFHGIRGAHNLRIYCAWAGCTTELNRESLLRHVKSRHLFIVYPCRTCNRRFTRRCVLNQHQITCPSLQ